MAHAQSDAAKNLMVAAKEAVTSYEGLRNNTNTSKHRATASDGCRDRDPGQPYRCYGAVDGLSGFPGELRESTEQEIARREELARFVEAEREAQIAFDAQQAGIAARVDSMREGFAFQSPGALRRDPANRRSYDADSD